MGLVLTFLSRASERKLFGTEGSHNLSLLELNSTSKYIYNGEAKCHIKYCLKNVSLYLKNDRPTSIQIKFMIHLLHQVFQMRNFS